MSASLLDHGNLFDDLGTEDSFDDLEPDDAGALNVGIVLVEGIAGQGVGIDLLGDDTSDGHDDGQAWADNARRHPDGLVLG